MLSAQQIDTILTLAQEFADARATANYFNVQEYNELTELNDLLADEKVCYNELVNYLKEI